jgi:hypothetical protein
VSINFSGVDRGHNRGAIDARARIIATRKKIRGSRSIDERSTDRSSSIVDQ